MDPTVEAVLQSWSLDPWLIVPLLVSAGIYARGWLRLQGRRFAGRHLAAFFAALLVLFLAVSSPLDAFAGLLLQVHMAQHMLLMMVVPPLLWLAAPALPLLRGLPVVVRRQWIGPLVREPVYRLGFRWLVHPLVAWTLFAFCVWFWHAPQLYELGLRSPGWHYFEHACFVITGLLFWWPVVQPYPSRPHWSRWIVIPYLLLADVQNTVLSALFCFANRVIYPHYAAVPRLGGISALDDQSTAGLIMWGPGSLAYLLPLVWISARLLCGGGGRREIAATRFKPPALPQRIALPLLCPPVRVRGPRGGRPLHHWDLLSLPLVGRFLKWRHARTALQVPVAGLAAAVVLDGLLGPQVSPMNLAGVLPWVHWRGLVVLSLLVAGNLFCLACPFTLPRRLAQKCRPTKWRWPRSLRSKWLAALLLALFFVAYEVFALWDSPWWTAWIALGYFLSAFAIDLCFEGAVFCKYLCPIGQFQFVLSTASPLEVGVRDPAICRDCVTQDCIRGGPGGPGCAMHLFQPHKSGNLDCTFCLDCLHACPQDNIAVESRLPAAELLDDRHRSGIGRLSQRVDLAVLAILLTFGAFANAAGMAGPVLDAESRFAGALGLSKPAPLAAAGLLTALLVLPAFLTGAAAVLGRWWSRDPTPLLAFAARFAFALIPLGFGMWLAHSCYHFLPAATGLLPVVQRVAKDMGIMALGEPEWRSACCAPAATGLLKLELFFLALGLLATLYVAYRLASDLRPSPRDALKAWIPWAALALLLYAAGVWILFQPMAMRGTMM